MKMLFSPFAITLINCAEKHQEHVLIMINMVNWDFILTCWPKQSNMKRKQTNSSLILISHTSAEIWRSDQRNLASSGRRRSSVPSLNTLNCLSFPQSHIKSPQSSKSDPPSEKSKCTHTQTHSVLHFITEQTESITAVSHHRYLRWSSARFRYIIISLTPCT